MYKHRLAFLSVAVLLIGCEDKVNIGATVSGSIEGSVMDVSTGHPVDGATLLLVDPDLVIPISEPVLSDRNGRYRIEAVQPGEYSVFIYHDTLIVYDRSAPLVRVEEEETTTYQIRMIRGASGSETGFRVAGTVFDAVTGDPVSGAFVGGIYDAWNDLCPPFRGTTRRDWAVTDSSGSFSVTIKTYYLDMRPIGLEPISVTRKGYLPYSLGGDGSGPGGYPPPLPVPTGEESTLVVEVRLRPLPIGWTGPHGAGSIRGRVSYLGAPISQVRVAVSMLSSAHPETLRAAPMGTAVPIQGTVGLTDAEGRFQIDRLTPGYYVVHPAYRSDDGYVHLDSSTLRVEAGQVTEARDLLLMKAISAIYPPSRSVSASRTPRFEWEGHPIETGYEFLGYRLRILLDDGDDLTIDGLTEAEWQVPDSLGFTPGTPVRWSVDVMGRTNDVDPPETIATFEMPSTFTVAP